MSPRPEPIYLLQRISTIIQQGNAAAVLGTTAVDQLFLPDLAIILGHRCVCLSTNFNIFITLLLLFFIRT